MDTIRKQAEWQNSRGIKVGYRITLTYGRTIHHDDIAGDVEGAYHASLVGEVFAGANSYIGIGPDPSDRPEAAAKVGPLYLTADKAAQYKADYDELRNHPAYAAYLAQIAAADQVAREHRASEQHLDNTMTLNGRTY